MNRRAPLIWALVVALGTVFLLYREGKSRKALTAPVPLGADSSAQTPVRSAPNGKGKQPTAPQVTTTSAPTAGADSSGQFHTLPGGIPVPTLPETAPEKVKLAVVLFRYQGAQGAADSTRTREAARVLALEAQAMAKTDLAAAVRKGDRGSDENVGWMRRRILERAVEYAVFSLEVGALTPEPIDTPRGFWVVKRLR